MILLIYSLMFMQILDGLSTYLAISSGNAVEANPIADMLFNAVGMELGIVLGKLVVIAVLFGLVIGKYKSTTYRISVLTVLNVIYFWIVFSNFQLI